MAYAHVVSGTINRIIESLPENLGNVSGFNRLTPAELAARNWLPIVDNRPALADNLETYGPPTVTITATEVVRDFPVVNRGLAVAKALRRVEFRDRLKAYVYETFDLDDIVAMLLLNAVPTNFKNRVLAAKAVYDGAITDLTNASTVADVRAIAPAWPA